MDLPPHIERRALQTAIALGCLVPILAGGAGIVLGPAMLGDDGGSADLDSHFRYLSGLLFGIGLGYASTVRCIERHTLRIRLLTTMVFVGGLGRLISTIALGHIPGWAIAALVMELGVAPALALWQWRMAARHGGSG